MVSKSKLKFKYDINVIYQFFLFKEFNTRIFIFSKFPHHLSENYRTGNVQSHHSLAITQKVFLGRKLNFFLAFLTNNCSLLEAKNRAFITTAWILRHTEQMHYFTRLNIYSDQLPVIGFQTLYSSLESL